MADPGKGDVPMLDSRSQFFDDAMVGGDPWKISARSASMSISMNALRHYEAEDSLSSHTSPLISERPTSFLHRSSPIYGNRKSNNFLVSMPNLVTRRALRITGADFSFRGMADRDQGDDFGGQNEHLLNSGPLGVCSDPYCITCPTYYNFKAVNHKGSKASALFETKIHNALYGDAKGWARRSFSYLSSYIPGIMNPHAKAVQRWNKFFIISCFVAIFVDPMFFFLLHVQQDNVCMVFDWPMAVAFAIARSVTDFIHLLHMLLQFRLAYVAPESRVIGAGDLVDQPKKIALHYLRSYFIVDLFVVLPLPQIMTLLVIPNYMGTSAASFFKNLLRGSGLLQYAPRIYRFLPFLAGQSASGFIFESAWANFVINVLNFMLASHILGAFWYLFGLQRVYVCLQEACLGSNIPNCTTFMDCGVGKNLEKFANINDTAWQLWQNSTDAGNCFQGTGGPFNYGIYFSFIPVATESGIIPRYVYALFWGFQQVACFAGNQVPSPYVWESLFTAAAILLGLVLVALLMGNMQNFLQAVERRKWEMQLRRQDAEQWMRHRRLPEGLRRRIRQSERFNWAATHGVNEEVLLEKLPEDLQREIRRHLFTFIKKVRIFTLMDEPILDAICERLRQTLYIEGSRILFKGGPIDKMVFIVRGKLENIGGDGNIASLSEGDVCGEELLTWSLEQNRDGRKIRFGGLFSSRTVTCLTNVEAFSLRASDLEEVASYFSRFLRNPRVQGAIRYESPYWRTRAAIRIQGAWRYRQKQRLNQPDIPKPEPNQFSWYQAS